MLIKQEADIQILSLDIMAKLHEYPVDVEAVNKTIDQKYDLKKAKAKNLVEAFAKLKGTLTSEQYDKLKSIWKSNMKKHHDE